LASYLLSKGGWVVEGRVLVSLGILRIVGVNEISDGKVLRLIERSERLKKRRQEPELSESNTF